MQVERPEEGTYLMPVVWYFAPEGAKTMTGINAFTSGNWDRDKQDLPPLLGAQPPYNSPWYNGKNVWGYIGQCQVGTPEQFELGLTQKDLDAPVRRIPFCCNTVGPLWFDCPAYPEGLPSHLSAFMTQLIPGPWPFPELLNEFILDYAPNCSYLCFIPDNPPYWSGAFWVLTVGFGNSTLQLRSLAPTWTQTWQGLAIHTLPVQFVATTHTGVPPADFFPNLVTLYTFPFNPMVQTIVLAGDTNGSADLGPTGCTIINALANVVTAGTVGDASHVPVVQFDSKGRAIAFSQVAIASAGIAIGDHVGGSTPNRLLLVDSSGNLWVHSSLAFDGVTFKISGLPTIIQNLSGTALEVSDVGRTVNLCDGTNAGIFSDGTRVVTICDGVNNVLYTWGGGSPAWGGTPPTDVWIALDRLAAWMAANFPLLPGP